METQRSADWLDGAQIWERALDYLRQTLTEEIYSQWFAQTRGIEVRSGALYVAVADTYARETLRQSYYLAISRAVQEVSGRRMNVEFQIRQVPADDDPGAALQVTGLALKAADPEPAQPLRSSVRRTLPRLRPEYTFGEFVIGEANRVAANAALGAAQAPGEHNNPLFIYSDSGQGKTHLLQAISHVARERDLQNIVYCSAERFLQDYVAMVRGEFSRDEFASKYHAADVLAIDDLQLLTAKSGTQDELFQVLDAVIDRGGQVVFSADQPPWRMHGFTQRLATRCEGGVVVEIQRPDPDLAISILQRTARKLKLALTDDAARLIAEQASPHVRALIGALNRMRVEALSQSNESQRHLIGVELATRVLLNYEAEQPTRQPPTISELMGVASTVCEVPLHLFASSRRDKRTVRARQLVMYLAREYTQASFAEIASQLGRKDHTTVMYGCNRIEAQLKHAPSDDEWAAETRRLYREICKRLRLS